ncbi:MAG: undecaprenyl-diphosphate phosphatase [Candidatus Omnitrophica bacterium]|nr:undecaprenyl-diphosphate phosphatase [Candidatus Omnitrophota bacterium]
MFEHIILGAIQGITEWVPISSKGCVIAAKVHFFHSQDSLNDLINYALLLHLGTFFAAVVYFWKDIQNIFRSCLAPQDDSRDGRKVLIFLLTTTVLTALGQLIINHADALAHSLPHAKTAVTSIIAACLIIAGFVQLKAPAEGERTQKDLTLLDGLILGLTQAIATMPGLSRAGTTMAALSFRKFDKEHTLKLSFLMSLPVILVGNIVKNHHAILTFGPQWMGVLASFVVGILSIKTIMGFARRINFGWFLVTIGSILSVAILTGMLD